MDIQLSHADLWCSAILGALSGMAWAWAMFVRQSDPKAPAAAFSFSKFCWPVLTGAGIGLIRRMHLADLASLWGAVDRVGGVGLCFVGLLILQRRVVAAAAGKGKGLLDALRSRLARAVAPPFAPKASSTPGTSLN